MKKNNSNLLIAILAIALIAAGGALGYVLYQQSKPAPVVVENEISVSDPQNQTQDKQPVKTEEAAPDLIVKDAQENKTVLPNAGEITWNEPQKIADLKIMQSGEGIGAALGDRDTTEYYKVGIISRGQYEGGQLILVKVLSQGPMASYGFYRIVKQGDNITLLKKYSDELYDDLYDPTLDKSKFTIDDSYSIPALDFPKTINGPAARQTLNLDWGVMNFFEPINIKKVFTDKKLGDVYTTAGKPSENKTIYDNNGFYIKAPDGTLMIYKLTPDFEDEGGLLQITWNDGSKNKADYNYADVNGCGNSNYASVILPSVIDINRDLKISGKNSKGDNIYELKDVNHGLLKEFYDNKYYAQGGKKMAYSEFVAAHPLFFWVDPFGRLIKFQNKDYQPPVECGKPVIYLYPEKTEKITVKIAPKGGLSYSEPDYGRGWLVTADPAGNLKEVSSGKNYPYLFWEGRGGIYETPKQGFVVEQKNVHSFLIEKLFKLGLNAKETGDFMDFWEPRMQGSPYYFVTFLGNRQMDQIAPLVIDPKPDTVIRILMDFTPINDPIAVEGYEIKTPVRKGFTVVEWGGVIK